jgi:hypothetical protein
MKSCTQAGNHHYDKTVTTQNNSAPNMRERTVFLVSLKTDINAAIVSGTSCLALFRQGLQRLRWKHLWASSAYLDHAVENAALERQRLPCRLADARLARAQLPAQATIQWSP